MLFRVTLSLLPLLLLPLPILLEDRLIRLDSTEQVVVNILPLLLAAVAIPLGLSLKHYRAVWLSLHLLGVGSLVQLLAVQSPENPARYMTLVLISLLWPLMQYLILLLPDRHLLSRIGFRRAVFLIGPYVGLLLLWHYGPLLLTKWLLLLPPMLLEFTFAGYTLSHGALSWNLLLMLASLAFLRSNRSGTLVTLVLTTSMLIGIARPDTPLIGSCYHLLAQLILLATLFQRGYSMAFLDTLTGVPGRRALEHYLQTPGQQYVIAMLDIDHFKKFNDRYGHDTGDQVLRMVATQLNTVTAGGRLFRYGGEEFTIVFRRRGEAEALTALEAVREKVAAYPLVIRDDGRPKNDDQGKQQRRTRKGNEVVNVTISIGACENRSGEKPEQVIKRADQALYLAKEQGRNCVRTGKERPQAKRRNRSDFARDKA